MRIVPVARGWRVLRSVRPLLASRRCALAMLSFLAAGCAGVATRPIDTRDPAADEAARGIRYYEVSPYLIVVPDGKGGHKSEVKFLPDQTRLMSAEPTSIFAKLDMTLTFQNGVLTTSATDADSTAIPKVILDAVATAAPLIAAALNIAGANAEPSDEYTVPAPHIYKIVITGSDATFYGGPGDTDFKVTLQPKDK
ncbi:MAG: hypothetical protein K8T90_15670 [Planctomycetes bacterium]|nr:hypothetical protein [Planctomycetota bacterium]